MSILAKLLAAAAITSAFFAVLILVRIALHVVETKFGTLTMLASAAWVVVCSFIFVGMLRKP